MDHALDSLSVRELMRLYRAIGTELIDREVCRTRNSPTGDIAEYLFSQTFGWKLGRNSRAGFDAMSEKYGRVQIKSRFLSTVNASRQAGDIRQLNERKFDWLGAVVFSPDASVLLGLMIPHAVVVDRALKISHTNSFRIYLKDDWLDYPDVFAITDELSASWERINAWPIRN